MDFIPYSSLRDLLNLQEDTIEGYPDLAVIRKGVLATIESYLGRTLTFGTYTQTVLPKLISTRMVYLDALPVSAVTSVTIDDAAVTDYQITDYGIRMDQSLCRNKIVVVYTGGLAAVPDDLLRAGLIQVAYEYQAKQNIGAETISNEGGSISRPALQLLPEVKRTLSKLKHPREFL